MERNPHQPHLPPEDVAKPPTVIAALPFRPPAGGVFIISSLLNFVNLGVLRDQGNPFFSRRMDPCGSCAGASIARPCRILCFPEDEFPRCGAASVTAPGLSRRCSSRPGIRIEPLQRRRLRSIPLFHRCGIPEYSSEIQRRHQKIPAQDILSISCHFRWLQCWRNLLKSDRRIRIHSRKYRIRRLFFVSPVCRHPLLPYTHILQPDFPAGPPAVPDLICSRRTDLSLSLIHI